MEARHWWLVNRIQETFKFGINDSPVLYEQFLADASNIREINKFLSPHGCRLLIFYDVFSDEAPTSRELRVVTELTPEADIYQESNLAVVFFRPEVLTEELDLTCLQQDVMCVELKLTDLTAMLALISQLYLPMVEQEAISLQNIPQHEIDNYRKSVDEHLQELTSLVEKAEPHLTILTPHTKLIRDPNWRNSPMAPDICTTMLQDWLPTIHSHLTDAIDTANMEIDTQSSPMEELRKWNARQKLFTSILKQMRGQEIKSTVKLLTTTKPDLVHMWGEAETQVIHINSVAKNKLIFLDTINNHFSTMLHCSSIESLNSCLSAINSNPGFFLGFQLPSQRGYLGYVYYKLVCAVIKLSATFLLNTKPVTSSWFLLDANKGTENYPKFLQSLSDILKLEENFVRHFELLKEKGLLQNISTLSAKTTCVFEDQHVYKEFSSIQTLISPLKNYTQHIHSLLNLSNDITKLGKLCIRLMPYPFCPDILWTENPIIISSDGLVMINIPDEDEDDFFQDNPPVISRKKRPIGSGKMGILLEVDEEKNLDTPVLSIQNSDTDLSSEISESDPARETILRVFSHSSDQISSWLDNNLLYAYEELPRGPEFLFEPNNSNYESFDKLLICIVRSIEILNGNIELTLTELTNSQFSMYEQLSLVDIFNEWAVDLKAVEFSKSYLSKAFSQTEEKIFSLERRFLEEKCSPSKLIDVTRVSESVRWSRLLLGKLDQPMERLSKYDLVLKNPEYVETFNKYNSIRSDLKHYEKIWIKFCHEAIKEIGKQQQNKLLFIPQENELIRINLNPIIFVAIRELKSLVKLGINIPVKSQDLLFNEDRLKGNFDRLNLLKCEFLKFHSQIPEYLISLYEPRLKIFLKSLQPGWTHLTWKNINLDIFFEAANRELTKLNISFKEVSFDISTAKDTFQSNLENLPSILNNVLTSDSSFTIDQFQTQITNFTGKARSKMENHLQTFHFIICRSYLKINQLYQEYESISQEEIFEMMNNKLEKDSNSSSMECFLQYYISWSHECLYTWVTDQFQQYLSLVNFTLHQSKENVSFLEKQLSNLQMELAPVLVNLHKFVTTSDFNEVVKSFAKNKLRISCEVIFEVPYVISVPSYETISETILDCFDHLVTIFLSLFTPRFAKLSGEEGSTMNPPQVIVEATNIRSAMKSNLIELIHPLRRIFNFFSNFDSIRRGELFQTYEQLRTHTDCLHLSTNIVHSLFDILTFLRNLPPAFNLGILKVSLAPMQMSLVLLIQMWKDKFSSYLLENFESQLNEAVTKREMIHLQLEKKVDCIFDLDVVLKYLCEIFNLEFCIEGTFSEIDLSYQLLESYEVTIKRAYLEEVNDLRKNWQIVLERAKELQELYIKKNYLKYQREIEREMKTFEIQTINLLKEFEAEGPCVSGIDAGTAVSRLNAFSEKYTTFLSKKELLSSLQTTYFIPTSIYSDLDKVGKEIAKLKELYLLYENFCAFEDDIKSQTWSSIQFDICHKQICQFNEVFEELDESFTEWDAYRDIGGKIQSGLKVVPILRKIQDPTFKPRHWLRLMALGSRHFTINPQQLTLEKVLKLNLVQHSIEIDEICKQAQSEAEVDKILKSITNELQDQIFIFINTQDGLLHLSVEAITKVLEILDHHYVTLTTVLTSKYISHFLSEATELSTQITTIQKFIQNLTHSQTLAFQLDSIFKNNQTDLPPTASFNEAQISFLAAFKRWKKLMIKIEEPANIVLCCNHDHFSDQLECIIKEFENCQFSLEEYLDTIRKSYPFLYFLSDNDLLDLHQQQLDSDAIVPHVKQFFPQFVEFIYEEKSRRRSSTMGDPDKRIKYIKGFLSSIGEEVILQHYIPVCKDTFNTLNELMVETRTTLQSEFSSITKEHREKKMPNAEYDLYIFNWETMTSQITLITLHSIWTKNVQEAIINFRSHKNALTEASSLFYQHINRMLALINNPHGPRNPTSVRSKLECIVYYGLWLRDISHDLAEKKPRDISDFEWQKYVRMYYHSVPVLDEPNFELVDTNEQLNLTLRCLFTDIPYGFDYIGNATPNFFLTSSTKTIHLIYVSILEQRHTQFKTNLPLEFMHSAKEFARLHGRHMMPLRIHDNLSPRAMSCYLLGTLMSKYWGLINGWNNINKECLSIFTSVISRLHECIFPVASDKSIRIESSILMVVTSIDHFLPCNLRPYFKSCSYIAPNDHYILKLYCFARGIKSSKQLIDKMLWLKDILPILFPDASHVRFTIPFFISMLNHISAEKHKNKSDAVPRRSSVCNSEYDIETELKYLRTRRRSISNVRANKQVQSHRVTFGNILSLPTDDTASNTAVTNKDQKMIASYLVDICIPRFQPQFHSKFIWLLDTLFGTSHTIGITDSTVLIPNFNSLFVRVCSENELIPTPILEQQVLAIHRAANTYHGFILYGKAGTGKTTAFNTFLSCIRNTTGDITNDTILKYSNHKTYYIYLKTLYSHLSLIGKVDERHCWRDGILSQAIRYANTDRNCLVWIIFDDIIQAPLFEFLASCIYSYSLTLSNGQCLAIPNNVRFVLETINLSSLCLSYLNLFQMLYFADDTVKFESFAMLSIQKHPPDIQKFIQTALDKIMGTFLRNHITQYPAVNESNFSSLFKTFFTYFDQLIANYISSPSQPDPINLSLIERFTLFALMSSFGTHLEEYKWTSFTQDLHSISECLPDLEPGLTMYDYCISSLGDWDTLHMVYSDLYPSYSITCNGDIVVKCNNLYRINMLAELCNSSERPIMLIGPPSSGKSCLIKNLIYTKCYEDTTQDVLHQAIDPCTTVSSLYDSLFSRLECRYLDTYGPPSNHKLNFFIDDLHIGQSTGSANSPVQEFIRCLIERKGCFSKEFPTRWLTLKDVNIICALTSESYQPWTQSRMSQHFNVIRLLPEVMTQDTVYHLLDALTQPEGMTKYSPEVIKTITKTSQTLYQLVSSVFQPADIIGRGHYYFSWKELALIFHGFRVCADELLERESDVFNLLYHITNRVYSAQLCNLSDIETFKCIMEKQWQYDSKHTSYIEIEYKDIPYFTTLVEEHKPDSGNSLHQSLSHAMEINTNIILHPSTQRDKLVAYATKLQNQFDDKFVEKPCISVLTISDIKQLDYLSFILSLPKSNILLVGRYVNNLSDIARLAYFTAGFEYLELILSTKQSFIDGIKTAIRQAALGSKSVGFILTGEQLQLNYVRELFNTYLVTGHVDQVFSYDEFNSLVSSIEPIYKRCYANTYTDARQYFSVQIQKNLKVIICLEIHNPLLLDFKGFPGLIKGCYISLYKNWCGPNMIQDMIDLVNRPESKICIGASYKNFPMENIITLCSSIHNTFIQEDRILNIIERNSQLTRNAFNLLNPFVDKESRRSASSLSQLSFEDRIKYIQENEKVGRERIRLIEGFSLQKFIKVFFTIYMSESKSNERKGRSLKKCISTREYLQNMHVELIKEVSRIEEEIIAKDAQCESLLEKLSQISCKIESVKVFSSDSNSNILRSTLATIRTQDETSMEMLDFEEDRQLISNLLENETQLKQSSYDEHTKRQYERIEKLQIDVDRNAKLVEAAASEVRNTFNKIGRNTLESVKLLHTPPKHVTQVLEILVFILRKQQRALSSSITEMATCSEPDAIADSMTLLLPKAGNRVHSIRTSTIPLASRSSNEAWNSIQHGIGQDAQKFLDSLHKLPWKFGLDPEVMQFIERNILTSRNSSQNKAGAVLITVQSAKHAAEGAGIICAYIIALAEYTYIYRQNCVFEEEICKLSAGITEISQKPITSHIDLPTLSYEKQFLDEQQVMEYNIETLETELNETESEFHRAVHQQFQLKEEFTKQKTLTQSLCDILKSTESLKSSWQHSIESLYDEQTLLYYCIATSLLICYLGSTPPSLRKVFLDDALNRMSSNLEEERQFYFSYEAFSEFLQQIIKQKPNLTDIPCDNYVQENISIIFNPYLPNFPLILDPYRIFLSWIREETGFMCTSYFAKNLLQLIEGYSKQSKKLVIYDVDLEDLAKNKAIVNILIAKSVRFGFIRKPTYPQKEILVHTSFKLFLVCPIKKDIPYSLLGYVTPVLFSATREGFAKDLCRVCMSAVEPLKYTDMRKNEAKLLDSRSAIENLENELSNALCISFEVDNLITKCKTITSLSSDYQTNKEKNETAKTFLQNLFYKCSHVFDGGEIAAIIFDVTRCMQSLNANYQSTYPAFKHFIRSAGENIDRINPKNIPKIIIRLAYSCINQSFSEDDRVHFALVLAIEIEIYRKKARRSDAEMLFSPLNPVKHNTKKPFDWMQEKQWENFNAMGQSVKKIQDAVDRMAREGRATQWRTFCEHESPEEQDFPDGLNNTLSPLEKLLILKCVKQDNLKNSITRFIDNCLGVDLINGNQADYNVFVAKVLPPRDPLLIFSTHPLYTVLLLNSMTKTSKTTLDVIPLYGNLPEDIQIVFEGITKSASQGNWLFIENIELNPQLMKLVPYHLDSLVNYQDSFCLWFGCSLNASLDPVFVQRCLRIYLGIPLDPKISAVRCLELLDLDDSLEAITRTEWTPILHNLVMVHVACRYRVMLCPSSFGQHYRWSLDSLIRSLRIILLEIDQCANTMLTYSQQNKPFSWSCVKYMIGELTYGSGFVYAADIELLNGMFDYWLNPSAMKSLHDFPRSQHKIPNAFFKTNPKPKDLILGFLHETSMLHLRSPEICGLYSRSIFFSPDKIVNNTKLLNDSLKIYRIEEQQLITITPSTKDNVAPVVDKIRNYRKRSSSFLDVSKRVIGRFPADRGIQTTSMASLAGYITHSHSSIRGLKDLSIQEKCSLLLSNLPKLVTIEILINKCEQYSNQYLQRCFIQELNTWAECIGMIRSDLQVIQNYLLFSKLVGTSSVFLNHIIDLHENRVPPRWERLIGPSAPPNTQPFSTWIENLTKRYQYLFELIESGNLSCYNLGYFFYPGLLLAAFCLLKSKNETLSFEKSVLIGEITTKEKEHVKDPPAIGMYASEISIHGCLWDKSTGEFHDMPTPKSVTTVLPLVQITRFQASQLSARKDGIRGPHLYYCPVYRNEDKKEIFFYIKVQNTEIPRIRWMMRGLTCTMQHY